MSVAQVSQMMDRCRLFAAVQGESRQRLIQMALITHHEPEEMVFSQGDACPGVYIVGEGMVRVYKISPAGKEAVLHLVEPGGTFAEVAAIGGFACPAFAQALEPTACVLLPGHLFRKALQEDHQLCLQLLMGMAGWVKHLVGIVESITLRDAMQRVAHSILENTSVQQPVLQLAGYKRHLASRLNLTSETLSRVLRKLKDEGVIGESSKVGLEVLNRQELLKISQGESIEMSAG